LDLRYLKSFKLNPMKNFFRFLLFVLILLGGFLAYIFSTTGFFRKVESSNDFGPIYQTIALPGVEDMAIARADSLLILSVDDRAARREGKTGLKGLYLIDLRAPSFEPVSLTDQLDFPFFPHGLSIFQLDSAKYGLMAINHVDGKHSVEHFILEGKMLTHQKTITDPNFISPNDLVMVGPEKFYYSNDHGYTSGLGVFAENYIGWKASNVGFYDGTSAVIKAGSIGYANGIQFESTKNLLFVASVRGFLVKVYRIDENWNLTHLEDIKTGTGVDNIELDESGNLWIGAHPNLLRFASYAAGKNPTAPSEVIQIRYSPEKSAVESVYTDPGTTISGTSVALPWGDFLFVGNVMDSKFMVLKRN
jgi:arylesterase/paraoxonase